MISQKCEVYEIKSRTKIAANTVALITFCIDSRPGPTTTEPLAGT